MTYASVAFIVFGVLVLIKALSNPQLRELRLVDSLQLVAIGMFVGVGLFGLFSRFVHNE